MSHFGAHVLPSIRGIPSKNAMCANAHVAAALRSSRDMDPVLREFLVESSENLDQFERDLVGLEQRPDAHETLDNAFRAIHSIKGATGYLGLSKLGGLAHAGESLLSDLREGRVPVTPAIASDLLQLVDFIRLMLSDIERTGTDTDINCSALVERLDVRQPRQLAAPISEPVSPAAPPRPVLAPNPLRPTHASRSVRVDVAQLDVLMNLVGELVLTRNQMIEYSTVQQNPVLLESSQRLNAITTQLQAGIMKTRMQPIENVWSTFPRIVRDTALECGKQVRLELDGQDTELDKTLLEAIKDPLTHVVRNCVDHGIETAGQRLLAGKPAEGCLSMRAFHEGGQVHIEISDDGMGVDVAEVRRKAVERGFVTAEEADALSDQGAIHLIFLPGFSTAKTVTNISGRGVGMDVVKTNIEKIGGKVSVHSRAGLGTTVRIRIPLTLAIIPALIVTAGGDRFAIPRAGVLELIRLNPATGNGIEMMGDASMLRRRGALVPLVRLDAALGIGAFAGGFARQGGGHIIILQADERAFGLVIDDVLDTQEIVVKPLDRRLRALSMFAGATILGDGCVSLILDVTGLAVHAHVLAEPRRAGDAATAPADVDEETQALLAVTGDLDARMAIPLSQVTRLEEFPCSSIERLGDRDVVLYRGEMLPLIAVSDLLAGVAPRRVAAESGSSITTVVYAAGGERIGLVVRRILDTVEHRVADEMASARRGVRGSAVINGRATQILDLEALCAGGAARAVPAPFLHDVAV
jgi:two-component system chemotaxis sensor kinase CheA